MDRDDSDVEVTRFSDPHLHNSYFRWRLFRSSSLLSGALEGRGQQIPTCVRAGEPEAYRPAAPERTLREDLEAHLRAARTAPYRDDAWELVRTLCRLPAADDGL